MGQRSSIDELPPEIRDAALRAIAEGRTCDEIVARIRELGGDASRSAVGRYKKSYAEIAKQQRDLQAVSRAFAADFGEEGDAQGRLLLQLITSVATRAILPIAEGEEVELNGEDLHFYARAIKDITSAAKTNTDREAKVEARAAEKAKREAAANAETAARASGASPETVRKVRAAILGLAA